MEAAQQACKFFRISINSVSAYYGSRLIELNNPLSISGVPANATIRLKPLKSGL